MTHFYKIKPSILIKNLIFSITIYEIYAQPQSVTNWKQAQAENQIFACKQLLKPFIDTAVCGIQSEFSMREICKIGDIFQVFEP